MSDSKRSAGDRVYLDAPYISIHWESRGPWVVVEWKAWATSPQFRAAYEAILVAVSEQHATKLLVDLRNTRVLVDDDQKWLVEDWGPRSVQAGIRSMAVIIPERPLAKLILENIGKRIPSSILQVTSFRTLEEAEAWLA